MNNDNNLLMNNDVNKNILIENIILGIDCCDDEAIENGAKRLKERGFCADDYVGKIYKKSIDCRQKSCIKFVYSVIFVHKDNVKNGSLLESLNKIEIIKAKIKPENRPVVVGFGPAGMFCSLILARAGLEPIVIEMGDKMDEREKKAERLFKFGELDEKSNICFGEGGAGTFSDGKLITRIKDPLCLYILQNFVEFGADENILYNAKPHVGTDKIRQIVVNLRNEIIKLGAKVFFRSELLDLKNNNNLNEILINFNENKELIKFSGLFIAVGHSAFNIYDLLRKKGFFIEPKAYSVGFRIEHEQSFIDELIYGKFAGHKNLPSAEYLLADTKNTKNNRGVYTFCMCPGGFVVNSSSENGRLVTNGMSYFSRDGKNANSAVLASVNLTDYGGNINGSFDFREQIEKNAFNAGIKSEINIGNFAAPVQSLSDYMNNRTGNLSKSKVKPSYTGKICEADINNILPNFINSAIKESLINFDKKLKGFLSNGNNSVITAAETRTSSAVRILRNKENLEAIGFENIYVCGEGSGYAGGITSSAVDGAKCAIKFIEKYGGGIKC